MTSCPDAAETHMLMVMAKLSQSQHFISDTHMEYEIFTRRRRCRLPFASNDDVAALLH
jgi:hypothetical protein